MRVTKGLVLALVVTLVAASTPQLVLAHAAYERSSPGAGSVVSVAPERVDIWFTQELFRREGANIITVTGPDGQRVDTDDAEVDSADRTRLSIVLLPSTSQGVYTVAWASLSSTDGDPAEGSFTFTVDPNAPPSSGASATPAVTPVASTAESSPVATLPSSSGFDEASDEEDASFPWWVLVVGAAIGTSGAIVGWTLARTGPDGT